MRRSFWLIGIGILLSTIIARADLVNPGFLSGQQVRLIEPRADLKGPGDTAATSAPGSFHWSFKGVAESKGNQPDQAGSGAPNGPLWHVPASAKFSGSAVIPTGGLPAGRWFFALKTRFLSRALNDKSRVMVDCGVLCGSDWIAYGHATLVGQNQVGKWQSDALSAVDDVDFAQKCHDTKLTVIFSAAGANFDLQFNAIELTMAHLD